MEGQGYGLVIEHLPSMSKALLDPWEKFKNDKIKVTVMLLHLVLIVHINANHSSYFKGGKEEFILSQL